MKKDDIGVRLRAHQSEELIPWLEVGVIK